MEKFWLQKLILGFKISKWRVTQKTYKNVIIILREDHSCGLVIF